MKKYILLSMLAGIFVACDSNPTIDNSTNATIRLYAGSLDTASKVQTVKTDTTYNNTALDSIVARVSQACYDTLTPPIISTDLQKCDHIGNDSATAALPNHRTITDSTILNGWNIRTTMDSSCIITVSAKLGGDTTWVAPTWTPHFTSDSTWITISASGLPFKSGSSTFNTSGAQYKIGLVCGQ